MFIRTVLRPCLRFKAAATSHHSPWPRGAHVVLGHGSPLPLDKGLQVVDIRVGDSTGLALDKASDAVVEGRAASGEDGGQKLDGQKSARFSRHHSWTTLALCPGAPSCRQH